MGGRSSANPLKSAPQTAAYPLDRTKTNERLSHLDGLRGVAILLVVLYHSYSRHPDVPELYTGFFGQGHYGVQLFFLLSGFLIFHSLETSGSLGSFIYRRWLRLFPAMVVASCLILETSLFLYERPDKLPGYYDAFPGLLFIEPRLLRNWLGMKLTGPLEGAFWTLFTEIKFYLLFALAFALWRRKAVYLLAGVALAAGTIYFLQAVGVYPVGRAPFDSALSLSLEVNGICYGWFAAGALLYLYYDTKHRPYLAASVFFGAVGVATNSSVADPGGIIFCAAVYLAFAGTFFWKGLAEFLSKRGWVFFGFISYPLYLIHENASWAMILKIHKMIPALPDRLVPILPIAVVCTVAWAIAAYAEPLLREILDSWRKGKAQGGTLGFFRGGRANACAILALLAAAVVGASFLPSVATPRAKLEKEILESERAWLQPLEQKLSDDQRALTETRQARIQAEAYLASMPKPAP